MRMYKLAGREDFGQKISETVNGVGKLSVIAKLMLIGFSHLSQRTR